MLIGLPRKQFLILMLAIVIGWIVGERFAPLTSDAPWIYGEAGILIALTAVVGILFGIEFMIDWLKRRPQP